MTRRTIIAALLATAALAGLWLACMAATVAAVADMAQREGVEP